MFPIDNYNFKDKKVLIRVDFNVPLNAAFEITDDTRMRAALPTIKKVIADGGSVILMSHLGRPKNAPDEKLSLKHIVKHLSNLLGAEVLFAADCIGNEAVTAASALQAGQVLLLENLRFHGEEKKGDREFAQQLAALADVYVNDAFGTAHRAHASTTVVAEFFPNDKMFGYLIENELNSIDKVVLSPEKPYTAIVGGAKVSSKITIIENLLEKVDNLIIGGGMTYTFVKAQGGKIGGSLCEDDKLDLALAVMQKAKEKGVKLYLPIDNIVADSFSNQADTNLCPVDEVPDGWLGLDVGEATNKLFSEIIESSKTVLWNGPMGVFEMSKFETGTKQITQALVNCTRAGGFTLVGGGDSVAAVNKFGMAQQVSYVSTGGGALLEYMEGKQLPGIKAIR